MKSSENSKSESESWSLSLVKIGDDNQKEVAEEPVPLDVCLPEEMAADNELPPSGSPSLLQVSPAPNVSSSKSDEETVLGSCLKSSPENVGPIDSESNKKSENKERRTFMGDDESVGRKSPRFTSISAETQNGKTPLSLSLKSQSSRSQIFKLIGNKEVKIMTVQSMHVKALRRSPRFTSAPPGTKGSSSETMFKFSRNVSSTRSSGKLIDKLSCLSWPEDEGKGSPRSKQRRKSPRFVVGTENWGGNESLRKFEVHDSGLPLEKQLRRLLKTSQATKNGCSNVSVRRLDTHEIGFSGEKLSGMSPSSLQATENSGSDVSFKEHTMEMCNEQQLEITLSHHTSLTEVFSAEVNSSPVRLSESGDEHLSKKFKISSADSDMRMSDENFSKKIKDSPLSKRKQSKRKSDPIFIGNPIPDDEAQERWRWRYEMKNIKSKSIKIPLDDDDEDRIVWNVECHYAQTEVDGYAINLGDCVYIKGEEAKPHIGKILEFFKTTDGENYFRVQWFYRAEDTVMQQESSFHDERRLFYSTVMNDNPIDCIISKVSVTQISPKLGQNSNSITQSDFYFDMEYCVEYSTFRALTTDNYIKSYSSSNCCKEIFPTTPTAFSANIPNLGTYKEELALLDLYSGCGGMSTGLCLGAKASSIDLVTKWAVDSDSSACKSLKLNHPETHARNEGAADFLQLLKEWDKLCKRYAVDNVEKRYPSRSATSQAARSDANSPKDADVPPGEKTYPSRSTTSQAGRNDANSPKDADVPPGEKRYPSRSTTSQAARNDANSPKDADVPPGEKRYPSRSTTSQAARNDANSPKDADVPPGEFEVYSLVDICYGDPCKTGKRGLNFKVRWKGYDASEDTWEPIEGLRNCQECIQEFVRKGFNSKILPLRGDVDVICGGPPCQGISGYNRFRNVDSPLDDERNRQIVVFMDIVEYLKPKFVLMENVVDILRFDKASLGRYALSRLVRMKYQARLGIIAAGCYGLPQFRLRVFLWGAHPSEKLPQFPLPTHDVIVRYWPPPEFERNTVAYDEDQPRELEKALLLHDAISDLPAVANNEAHEEMSYGKPPETEFQRYIRSSKYEMKSQDEKSCTSYIMDLGPSVLNATGMQNLDAALGWSASHMLIQMTGSAVNDATKIRLYDHRPSPLSEDDYTRVCLIPKRKGANFRDLPGVIVGQDNVARRDPTQEKKLLPSGKPLVPDYVFTFEQGKSKRPFARLWWDETVPTLVTFPYCHSQATLHPEQDRVLTIREYARLQGFPDYYRFYGSIKERYCQIGNAVAVPVSRALGYALGMAYQKLTGDEPLMTLPPKFSLSTNTQLAKSLSQSENTNLDS